MNRFLKSDIMKHKRLKNDLLKMFKEHLMTYFNDLLKMFKEQWWWTNNSKPRKVISQQQKILLGEMDNTRTGAITI